MRDSRVKDTCIIYVEIDNVLFDISCLKDDVLSEDPLNYVYHSVCIGLKLLDSIAQMLFPDPSKIQNSPLEQCFIDQRIILVSNTSTKQRMLEQMLLVCNQISENASIIHTKDSMVDILSKSSALPMDCILIDDDTSCCQSWGKLGGKFVKHTNDEQTLNELSRILGIY